MVSLILVHYSSKFRFLKINKKITSSHQEVYIALFLSLKVLYAILHLQKVKQKERNNKVSHNITYRTSSNKKSVISAGYLALYFALGLHYIMLLLTSLTLCFRSV